MRNLALTCLVFSSLFFACSDDESTTSPITNPSTGGAGAGGSGSGAAGSSGSSQAGSAGDAGSSGSSGTAGVAGQSGSSGTSGTSGSSGSSGSSGTGGSAGYQGECTVLSLGDSSLFFASVARFGLWAPVQPVIPSMAKSRITLELYEDDGSGSLPALTTGTYQFASAPDDNYGTCQHCLLLVGYDLGNHPVRAFYAKNGEITITKLDQDDYSVAAGSVLHSELVEVIQNADFTWEIKPNGDCYYLDSWTFDTTPIDGGSCLSAEQCPNEVWQICEPETQTCGPAQCSLTFDPPFCPDDSVCLSQLSAPDEEVSGPALGACYKTCNPETGQPCSTGQICRALGPTQSFGICVLSGDNQAGQPCQTSDLSTDCEAGAVCQGEPAVCAPICDFLTAESGCPTNTYCTLANLCEPASTGDPASVGQDCNPNNPILVECGIEGDSFRGLCVSFFVEDTTPTCERLCRTADPQCPSGQTCLGVFSNTNVGICHTDVVCGDGVVDVIGGEICDDGNQMNGDGCNATCTAADLDVLCSLATAMVFDQPYNGNSNNGPTGYSSACDPFVATPVQTFSLMPPGPGKLVVNLSSSADLGVSILADCADSTSEIKCQNQLGDDSVVLQVTQTPTEPYLLVVRGRYPLEFGPFTVEAHFSPQQCGNGVIEGSEVCDDGNTNNADGCAADCSQIDWDAVCQSLPNLTLNTPINDSNDQGTEYFDLSGICSWVNGGGKERAYKFTAPSDGTLSVVLTQPSDNFSLYVEDGCGSPAEQAYLSCSNWAPINMSEMVNVSLTNGQVVTVVVDGFDPSQSGAFELSASFDATP